MPIANSRISHSFVASFLFAFVRAHPVRLVLSLAVIAFGVALGVAVYAINRSAVTEMGRAANVLAGRADGSYSAGNLGFDEAVYPALAMDTSIETASPVTEVWLSIRPAGSKADDLTNVKRLKVLGIDALVAGAITPALIGVVDDKQLQREAKNPPGQQQIMMFGDRVAFANEGALALLAIRVGESVTLPAAFGDTSFRVIGNLPQLDANEPTLVMDIATVQDQFARVGRLTRIDVRFGQNAGPGEQTLTALNDRVPSLRALSFAPTGSQQARVDRLSRSYRINLLVLAMVSLVTGAFLVLSSQALAIARRAQELALLGALGLSAQQRMRLLMLYGGLLGVIGSAVGVVVGLAIAGFALKRFGGDLGAGLISSANVRLNFDAVTLIAIGLIASCGIVATLLGTWLPARAIFKTPIAQQVKRREVELPITQIRARWGLALIALGIVLSQLKPINGVPVFGYAAIALWLSSAIMLIPWVTRQLLASALFARFSEDRWPLLGLARAQVNDQPGFLTAAIASVMIAVALGVSMTVMVNSFRQSLDDWLSHVLAADVYIQLKRAEDGHATSRIRTELAKVDGVEYVDALRFERVLLKPDQPGVMVIARDLNTYADRAVKPKRIERVTPEHEKLPQLWMSEALPALYGWKLGDVVTLAISGHEQQYVITAEYRDYARQFGSVTIDRDEYAKLTGDSASNDLAVWLKSGVSPQVVKLVAQQLVTSPGDVEIVERGEIRRISLQIFDRTFAVTYALQAAALLIALIGISSGFAALAFARSREYGLLQHLGFSRRDVMKLLAAEGLLATTIASLLGALVGFVISLILIYVVNRQSFHWGMELNFPFVKVAVFVMLMIVSGLLAAMIAGRFAMGTQAVQLVKDDA